MAMFLITWYSCSFLVLVACREIGSLPEQVKQKANLWDYNIQSRISPCLKKHFKIWVPSLQAINMCGLFTTFLLLTWKRVQLRLRWCVVFNCVTDQLTDRKTLNDPWLLQCIRCSYVCQRNTEKCSNRKHRQHEVDLLSKGRLWKGESRI